MEADDLIPKSISERDQKILDIGDDAYQPLDWDQLKQIINKRELWKLSRKPSDLLQYLIWRENTCQQYGSILNYILQEKLKWTENIYEVDGSSNVGKELANLQATQFKSLDDPNNIKILENDFPYGLEKGIVHLVVWIKNRLPQNAKGELTDQGRHTIENFVESTFKGVPISDLLWFKNTSDLQSVRAVEHFHVLLHNPPAQLMEELLIQGE